MFTVAKTCFRPGRIVHFASFASRAAQKLSLADALDQLNLEHHIVDVKTCLGSALDGIASTGPLNGAQLSLAIRGISRLSNSKEQVRAMLGHVASAASKQTMDSRLVLDCFQCLENKSSTDKETRDLVSVLVKNVSTLSVGECLTALSHCKLLASTETEVQELIGAFAKRIAGAGTEAVTPTALAAAYSGLTEMTESSEAVQLLLSTALNPLLKRMLTSGGGGAKPSMSADDVAVLMSGLCGMSEASAAGREVIETLTMYLQKHSKAIRFTSGDRVGDALYGLQRYSNEHAHAHGEVVTKLLQALQPLVHDGCTRLSMTPLGIAKALRGLLLMRSTADADRTVLRSLMTDLTAAASAGVDLVLNGTGAAAVPVDDSCALLQSLSLISVTLFQPDPVESVRSRRLRKFAESPKDVKPDVLPLSHELHDALVVSRDRLLTYTQQQKRKFGRQPDRCPTKIENRVAKDVTEMLSTLSSKMKLHRVAYVHGFPCDILVTADFPYSINVEVDEPHVSRASAGNLRRQNALRDAFLTTRGVVVLRVNAEEYTTSTSTSTGDDSDGSLTIDRLAKLRDQLFAALDEVKKHIKL